MMSIYLENLAAESLVCDFHCVYLHSLHQAKLCYASVPFVLLCLPFGKPCSALLTHVKYFQSIPCHSLVHNLYTTPLPFAQLQT